MPKEIKQIIELIDEVGYSSEASRLKGIQIKALSKRNTVPIGSSLDKCMGDYWVIINKVTSAEPQAFIFTSSEVKELAHRGEKEGRVSFWLQPNSYEQPQFKEAWERIGHGDLER